MKVFIYTNKNTGEKTVIKAKDILEADEVLNKKWNVVVSKCSYIGCEIVNAKGGINSGKT